MSKLEKLKDKAKGLEAKDPKGAIEAWLEVLQAQEEEGESNPDLSVFNRIGDLYLKVKDPGQAPESAGLREMLEEHLQMYGTPERRGSERVSMPAAPKGPPESKDDLSKSGKRKTSSLVFLDLDEPSPKSKRPTGPSRPPERVASLLTEEIGRAHV